MEGLRPIMSTSGTPNRHSRQHLAEQSAQQHEARLRQHQQAQKQQQEKQPPTPPIVATPHLAGAWSRSSAKTAASKDHPPVPKPVIDALPPPDNFDLALQMEGWQRAGVYMTAMTEVVSRHLVLGGVAFLGDEVWESLLRRMSTRALAVGDHLVRKGDFTSTYPICYVAEGRLCALGHGGKDLELEYRVGNFVLPDRQIGSITALTPCRVMVCEEEQYREFVRLFPDADISRKAQVLVEMPFFSHWGVSTLSVMPYHFRAKTFEAGTVLYREGEEVDTLMFILSGDVAREAPGPAGYSFSEGAMGVCGDPMALDGSVSDHTAVCTGEVEVWCLGMEGIHLLDYTSLERIHRNGQFKEAWKSARQPVRTKTQGGRLKSRAASTEPAFHRGNVKPEHKPNHDFAPVGTARASPVK